MFLVVISMAKLAYALNLFVVLVFSTTQTSKASQEYSFRETHCPFDGFFQFDCMKLYEICYVLVFADGWFDMGR